MRLDCKRRSIDQEVSFEQSNENRAELLDTPMSRRSDAADFNTSLRHHNGAFQIAEQWSKKVDALSTENRDLKNQTEELRKQNQHMQQR